VAGTKLKDEDFVNHVLHTTAHSYLLFFSNLGRVYRLKAHEIPMMDRTARGTAIVNLLPLQPDEYIQALIDTRDYETNRYLFFATRRARSRRPVHRLRLVAAGGHHRTEPARRRRAGRGVPHQRRRRHPHDLQARPDHPLRRGSEVRPMGRAAAGVRGMRLRDGDELVAADAVATAPTTSS
jgi:DNA gyrase subunit A